MPQEIAIPRASPAVSSRVRHLIAVGASAGGLHSLFAVLQGLPSNLPACVMIATHLSETHNSILPELLGRRTALAVQPADSDPLREGMVFVARPGFHLTIDETRMHLLKTPPVHFLRPNIDLLFESVAVAFGPHAVGVILSGTGHDGSQGIRAIKTAGGVTITEDPTEAEFNDMPLAASRTGCVDFVLPLDKIGEKLIQICSS
ncbi:MAG TPA: chemotaxis protein CheB [Terriglobales bacterium]|nr:chemotaxis protein CheB [Terriglobales bacterium]